MFKRKKSTTVAPALTEHEVIDFVTALPDEHYTKILKKFTAHRNLQKQLKSIEDGDLEDIEFIEQEKKNGK